jgi:hypothetical protein
MSDANTATPPTTTPTATTTTTATSSSTSTTTTQEKAITLFDYTAQLAKELSFKKNELLSVIDKVEISKKKKKKKKKTIF